MHWRGLSHPLSEVLTVSPISSSRFKGVVHAVGPLILGSRVNLVEGLRFHGELQMYLPQKSRTQQGRQNPYLNEPIAMPRYPVSCIGALTLHKTAKPPKKNLTELGFEPLISLSIHRRDVPAPRAAAGTHRFPRTGAPSSGAACAACGTPASYPPAPTPAVVTPATSSTHSPSPDR